MIRKLGSIINFLNICAVIFALAMADRPLIFADSTGDPQMDNKLVIGFDAPDEYQRWHIVNDVVMGGVSQSEMIFTRQGTALFQGILSLENNGAFASARTLPADYALSGFSGLSARVRGDGKRYQFRVRTDDGFDGVSYRATFETKTDTWTIVSLPFSEFVPTYHGRVLKNALPLDVSQVRQIGFLIADKLEGSFRLEVEWVRAFRQAFPSADHACVLFLMDSTTPSNVALKTIIWRGYMEYQ